MKLSFWSTGAVAALPLILALTASAADGLTEADRAAGWRLLFDGQSTNGWHSFRKSTFPASGWTVKDGLLMHPAKGGGGDIVSDGMYDQFELKWEWRIGTGGNSGLKYFVTTNRNSALGHEYQMIDDQLHPDAKKGGRLHQTGSFYDVLPPERDATRPAGEWNQSRILVQGNHVEHWLNGVNVLTYELGSEKVRAGVAASKFKTVAGFGTRQKGHILLQDHGDEVAFRNVMIREIK